MADSYDRYNNENAGGGFMMGLLTGTVIGAGIGMLLAPKAGSDLRGDLGEQARHIGNKASEQYRRASETATGWGKGPRGGHPGAGRGHPRRGRSAATPAELRSDYSTARPHPWLVRRPAGGTDYGRS